MTPTTMTSDVDQPMLEQPAWLTDPRLFVDAVHNVKKTLKNETGLSLGEDEELEELKTGYLIETEDAAKASAAQHQTGFGHSGDGDPLFSFGAGGGSDLFSSHDQASGELDFDFGGDSDSKWAAASSLSKSKKKKKKQKPKKNNQSFVIEQNFDEAGTDVFVDYGSLLQDDCAHNAPIGYDNVPTSYDFRQLSAHVR